MQYTVCAKMFKQFPAHGFNYIAQNKRFLNKVKISSINHIQIVHTVNISMSVAGDWCQVGPEQQLIVSINTVYIILNFPENWKKLLQKWLRRVRSSYVLIVCDHSRPWNILIRKQRNAWQAMERGKCTLFFKIELFLRWIKPPYVKQKYALTQIGDLLKINYFVDETLYQCSVLVFRAKHRDSKR